MKIVDRSPCTATLVSIVLFSLVFAPGSYGQLFRTRNLASSVDHTALNTNTNLSDPVQMVLTPDRKIWLANDGQGRILSFLFNGREVGPMVDVPSPSGGNSRSPGLAFNLFNAFPIVSTNASGSVTNGPSRFLIASSEGFIAGYNPNVSSNAVMAVDNTWTINTSYRSLALFHTNNVTRLFVTNFRGNLIEVYDTNFNLVSTFTDTNLPANYAPFGIAIIKGRLFVSFAQQADNHIDSVPGPGNGFVDVFDENGVLITRFASGGVLDTPYGMAVAPSTFGRLRGSLLIANHGDGKINAFNLATGQLIATLHSAKNTEITLPGLYGLLTVGGSVFFTSSTDEASGTFGVIQRR